MTTLEVKCLGGLTFVQDGIPVPELKSIKGRALLCYLAVSGKRFTRSALAGMFWTDIQENHALMNLRKVLFRMKPLSFYLMIDHDTLSFNHETHFWLDVRDFEDAAAARSDPQRLQYAVSLYQGDFLDGFKDDEIPMFADWVRSQRVRLRESALASLQTLIRHFADLQNYSMAIQFSQHMLKIEAWNEEAHCELMRLYALSGQRQQALRQYQTLCGILLAELDVAPSEKTTRQFEEIQSNRFPPPEALSSSALPSFPALSRRHNLPAPLTSFIGRKQEIMEVCQRVCQYRLVTLTGSGGVGKTRLALRAAEELLDYYPDGVYLVELAPLSDPMMIPQTVIAALGQIEQPGMTPTAFLTDFLRPKQVLLILDNVEHLVKACAELAAMLLHNASRLTILATSREILGVAGEFPYRVPPLGLPDPQQLPSLGGLAKFDALRLFVERAGVVSPGFALTEDNAPDVIQIIQRLDGIPLAIELAAARVRLLSVAQIALRLDNVFRLLTSGNRTAIPRHQTIKALIDWSYDLLSGGERSLLRSLSVFAGGWTVEAAEDVCGGSEDVLDLLGQLADKSLILAAPVSGGEMRYRMLETVRQYAHARLVDAGEVEGMHWAHLDYYLRLAEILETKLRGREQIQTLDYLGRELDNLRLALEWAMQVDVEAGLRLGAALQWFWDIRFHWSEGIAWLEQGLEVEALNRGGLPLGGTRAVFRAKALTALGLHIRMRDLPPRERALAALEEAIMLYRASGPQNRRGLAWALLRLGNCKYDQGDPAQARSLAEEALSLFRQTGDPHGMAESLHLLGECEIDPVVQKRIYQEQLAIEEANGDIDGMAAALFLVGSTNFGDGEFENGHAALRVSREYYRRVGNDYMVALHGHRLAISSTFAGDLERAAMFLEEALLNSIEIANDPMIVQCLGWKIMIAFAQGRYDQVELFIDESERIAKKAGNPAIFSDVHLHRARLARHRGMANKSRQHAEDGLNAGLILGPSKAPLLIELSYLAFQAGDLARAGALCREGLQVLIDEKDMSTVLSVLDGLAVLAVREHKLERAARLFGTKIWGGFAHTLSPIERTEREADLAKVKVALGEERFITLQAEGAAMTFMQILALSQEDG